MPRWTPRGLLLTLAGLAAAALLGVLGTTLLDPRVPLLRSDGAARWIRYDRPIFLGLIVGGEPTTLFRCRFSVEAPSDLQTLAVRGLGRLSLVLDGESLGPERILDAWNRRVLVPVSRRLSPGPHELVAMLTNANGPALFQAQAEGIHLATGRGWEVAREGEAWQPAVLAVGGSASELHSRFPSVRETLPFGLPLAGLLGIAAFTMSLALGSVARRGPGFVFRAPSARIWRWLFLGIATALAVNNFGKLPLRIGWDAEPHLDYVRFIVEHRALPLATDGWQMFQAPLFYALAAPLWALAKLAFDASVAERAVRLIPLLCGIGQVELAYRAVRSVFPDRDDLQVVGTAVGGFLPMNLYMSQYASNEPLAGFLSALALVFMMDLLARPGRDRARDMVGLGVCLGLAILAKVSALLLVAPAAAVALGVALRSSARAWPAVRRAGWMFGTVAVVCGWFFLRNWLAMGTPLVLSSSNVDWFQDPGYRVLEDLVRFGESLRRPIYSGTLGLWDSLYSMTWLDGYLSSVIDFDHRPPWNYAFVIGSAWLSLVPAAAIAAGAASVLRKGGGAVGAGGTLGAATLILYLGAIVHQYLHVPCYASGKATYALGLIPCFAVLAAAGFSLVPRRPVPQALIHAAMVCWAAFAVLGYWI